MPFAANSSRDIKQVLTYHGYKNHVCADVKHKFIRAFGVSPASLHDSQCFEELLEENEGSGVWADSAYRSKEAEETLDKHGFESHVHERAYRNTPLSEAQKSANTERSRVRARIEHIFGHMETAMGGLVTHSIGLANVAVKMTFKNLAYNMQRFAMLQRRARPLQEQCV